MAISTIGAGIAWLGSGTIAATIISGALVGAAIGGITALVTGGDIGQGMLYGAIGGAVIGGISGALGGVGGIGGGPGALATTGTAGAEAASLAAAEAAAGITTGVGGVGGMFAGLGEGVQGALIEGGVGLVGTTISGMAEEARAEELTEAQAAEGVLQREHEMAILQAKLEAAGGGGGAGDAIEVAKIRARTAAEDRAETRRQFEAQRADVTATRKRAAGALAGSRQVRGTFKGLKGLPAPIEEQVKAVSEYEEVPQAV